MLNNHVVFLGRMSCQDYRWHEGHSDKEVGAYFISRGFLKIVSNGCQGLSIGISRGTSCPPPGKEQSAYKLQTPVSS